MNHADMHFGHGAPTAGRPRTDGSLNRLALAATLHCLTGCAIGELLGLAIGTALRWGNGPTIALAIALAFLFGYALTLRPLLASGMGLGAALPLALASDTLSISLMELVDNAVMLAVPGAMDAHLGEPLFWGSMGGSLLLAGLAAWPLNRWLIARGRGHALVHAAHGGHAMEMAPVSRPGASDPPHGRSTGCASCRPPSSGN